MEERRETKERGEAKRGKRRIERERKEWEGRREEKKGIKKENKQK